MTTRTKTSSSTPMTKRSTKGHRSPIRKHSKSHLLGAISPGYSQGYAGYYKLSDRSGPYALDSFGNYGLIAGSYSAPNGKVIPGITTLDRIFSDDFGGSALNASYWDVIDGGLPATYDLGDGSFTNAAGAIGSGVTGGITYAVSASGLIVTMTTTNNAELWFLSKKCYNGLAAAFGGKEDIFGTIVKSQALVANSIFIGLCEVDPATGVPLANANLAGEFANKGGTEFGGSAVQTAYHCENIGDVSGVAAVGTAGTAAAFTAAQEFVIEIDSRDTICSTTPVDSIAAKASTAARCSSQAPNDQKYYKLVMRFKNVGAPATPTTVTIGRILVEDHFQSRVQVSTGEGDVIANKGIPVNVAGYTADNGLVGANPLAVSGIARSANRVAATTGRVISPTFDLAGNLVTKAAGFPQAHLRSGVISLANTTETSLLAAQGATVRTKLSTLVMANKDTIAHTFKLRDATAGTVQHEFVVAAGVTLPVNFPNEECAAAVNTAWTIQLGEAIGTVNPSVSGSFYSTTA